LTFEIFNFGTVFKLYVCRPRVCAICDTDTALGCGYIQKSLNTLKNEIFKFLKIN
jgi:hypothetical protein